VFSFIGESSELPVTVRDGKVGYGAQALFVNAAQPEGPARLFLRPHDVGFAAGGESAPGAIPGTVVASHRDGGLRRIDVATKEAGHRIEITLPAAQSSDVGGDVFLSPRRWQLYPST
jgi:sulfate transport system ATP-binding protein